MVVANREDEATWLSLRNAPEVHLIDPGQLNTYDVLISDDIVFVESAYERFVEKAVKAAGAVKGKSGKATEAEAEDDEAEGSDS
jgi:large subunit ribosomal protein L4